MRIRWRFVLYNIARLLRFVLYAYLILLNVGWIIGIDKFEAWRTLLLLLIPLIEGAVKKYAPADPVMSQNPANLNRLISDLKLKEGVLEYVDLPVTRVDRSGKPISSLEIPERFPRVVVVGKAGTGKTTLVRYLALKAAEACLKDKEQPFPILLDLSNWTGRKNLSSILKEIERVEKKPLSAIGQSNTYVFLDGLSASGPASAKQLQQLKSWLQSPHAPVRVLITCRAGENSEPVDLGVPVVELGELQEDHVREIAEHYLHDLAPDFLQRVLIEPQQRVRVFPVQVENPYAFAIARPFLLLTLIRAYERVESHELPSNPGALYDVLVKALWEQPEIRRMSGWIPFDQMIKVLSYWADGGRCIMKGVGLSPRKWDLVDDLDLLALSVQARKYERRGHLLQLVFFILSIPLLPVCILYQLVVAVIVIVRKAFGIYGHYSPFSDIKARIQRRRVLPLFQALVHADLLKLDANQVDFHNEWWSNYFRALQYRWNDIEDVLPDFRYQEARYSYRPVVIAASGLVADSDTFIRRIAQGAPYLAALCAKNSDKSLSPQTLQEIIDRIKERLSSADDPNFIRDYVYTLGLLCDASIVSELIDVLGRVHGEYAEDTVVDTLASYGTEAIPALARALSRSEDFNEFTKRALIKALAKTGSKQAIAVLKDLPESVEPHTKLTVAIALFHLGDQEARSSVRQLLNEHFKDNYVRNQLTDLGAPAIDMMAEMLQRNEHKESYILYDLFVKTSSQIGEPAITPLLNLLNGPDIHDRTKRAVIKSLGIVGAVRAVDPLIKMLQDANLDSPLRISAIEALGCIGDERAARLIIGCMEDKDADIRMAAVNALGGIGIREAVPALIRKLRDQEKPIYHDWRVCDAAANVLDRIDFPEADTALVSWYAELLENPTEMAAYERASGMRVVNALQWIGTKEAYDVLRKKYPETYE